jgi:hypothetical protein
MKILSKNFISNFYIKFYGGNLKGNKNYFKDILNILIIKE